MVYVTAGFSEMEKFSQFAEVAQSQTIRPKRFGLVSLVVDFLICNAAPYTITRFIYLFIFTVFAHVLVSQENDPLAVPALEALIDSAKLHSPLINAKQLTIEKFEQELKKAKKDWTKYIFIEGVIGYGQFDQLVISESAETNTVQSGLLNRSTQFRNYGGLGLKLPVSAIISRKNDIQIIKLESAEAQEEQKQLLIELEKMITDEYFTFLYLKESLKTASDMYLTLEVSYHKAKKDIESGAKDIESFALLSSTYNKAKDVFLKTKNQLFAQYYKLQIISGIQFNQ